MKKRVVAVLLSASMVIGTLAGCGSTQQAVSEEKSTTSAVGQETDDAKEEETLRNRFQDAIITNQNKTLERDSIAGMHDALIGLYCLSKTDKIFGSDYRSLTDIAADMNGIEKIVIGGKN